MDTGNNLVLQDKAFLWMTLATGLVLSVPLVAMQFTDQVRWSLGDFAVMGALLFGTGSVFVMAARRWPRPAHRLAAWAALGIGFLYLWAELAVGVFTTWGS
jgi:hypothetical protein